MDPQALFGPVTTRSHRVGDFDTFILNNIPYAQVPGTNIQWGAAQYDGPQAPGIDRAKPVLQWHFGGVPYPISKAIRLYYTYVRTWDGSGDTVTSSLLLGFQEDLIDLVVPQPIPFVVNPTQTYKTRVTNLGQFGQFSNQVWGSDPAVLASEANGIVTRALQQTGPVSSAFNSLIQTELGWTAAAAKSRFTALTDRPIPVDFDGPAQNSDSHNIFAYTTATLFNDQDKYGQSLFWYFAGKPYRLTKAMRLPLDPIDGQAAWQAESVVLQAALGTDGKPQGAVARTQQLQRQAVPATSTPGTGPDGHALFIGFAGPGSDPGG